MPTLTQPAGADLLPGKRSCLLAPAPERADHPGAAPPDPLPGTGEAPASGGSADPAPDGARR